MGCSCKTHAEKKKWKHHLVWRPWLVSRSTVLPQSESVHIRLTDSLYCSAGTGVCEGMMCVMDWQLSSMFLASHLVSAGLDFGTPCDLDYENAACDRKWMDEAQKARRLILERTPLWNRTQVTMYKPLSVACFCMDCWVPSQQWGLHWDQGKNVSFLQLLRH